MIFILADVGRTAIDEGSENRHKRGKGGRGTETEADRTINKWRQ